MDESSQRYTDFIQQIELSAIWLESTSVNRVITGPLPDTISINVSEQSRWQPSEEGFNAYHQISLKLTHGETDAVADIQVEMGVSYSSKVVLSNDLFDQFRGVNLPLNTWPYLREFVSSMTTRMNLPPLFLPSFKVGEFAPDVIDLEVLPAGRDQ